jgi:regulator of protease activity HflC (stomatin/prohibitin superfamily)
MNAITDIGRFIVEIIGFLWPLRIVWQWEQGAYYICGKYWQDVGPGLWPMIPFFMDVKTEGVLPQPFVTPLQTITTKDGGTLTFSATIKIRVLSIGKAYNTVLNWGETAEEDTAASLADELSKVESSRLEPTQRGRLIATCRNVLDKELGTYGLEIEKLRFNNFVRNMKVYRLLQDMVNK